MKTSGVIHFLRQYGFRLAVVLFGFLLVLFKDLNFQINLKAPDWSAASPPAAYRNDTGPSSVAAEVPAAPAAPKEQMQRFDLNPLGKSRPRASAPAPKRTEPAAITPAEKVAFIKRFAHVAVKEKEKFGVPASLILANGLLISRAGKSAAAQRANNFFSLPCTASWRGERFSPSQGCYRAYENAWTSFRDNSVYLTEGKFASLTQLESDDYRAWAKALERAGYYPPGLSSSAIIELVEADRLYVHDRN